MPGTKDAAWWRDYRARRRAATRLTETTGADDAQDRIRELEDEVRHLKRQLAEAARSSAEPATFAAPRRRAGRVARGAEEPTARTWSGPIPKVRPPGGYGPRR
jgi:hypothetical protein